MQKRVLGVDFGTRRVGVALSDPLRLFANRLVTVVRTRDDGVGPVESIIELCEKHDVDTVIIGSPIRTDGGQSDITRAATAFMEALKQTTPYRVELFDERYTSILASRVIVETEAKISKRRDKGLVDRVAAEILLQDWLDKERGGLAANYD
ncbi:MAG TPA: Holliday junction resolvase RuvX [Clostridia bacterium]|nr:Holliday junction resolvase RuvX [Clostridia bacterium]